MPDLTSQATTFRSGRFRYKLYLSYLPQTLVLACSINGTPTFSTTGSIQTITVDTITTGTVAAVKVGQTVEILSSTGVHKGYTRVAHGGGSGAVVQIAELSAGTINIADNDLVRVTESWRITDKLVSATAALNKDSRLAYSDQGSNPGPVCNSGGPVVGFVSGSTLTANFYGSTSRVIDPDSGGTITHAWTFPGATPSSSTDADPTGIAFPAGAAVWATHTATDAGNSKATTQYIPVWAHDTSTNAPIALSMCRLSYAEDSGWSAEFQIAQDSKAAASLLPDGGMVVIWAQVYYGDTEAAYGSNVTGRSHILFSGYLDRTQIRVVPETNEVNFTAISPLGVLAKTPALPQLTIQKTSPTKWSHLKTNSVYRTLWYLWHWHNTAFNVWDFVLPASGDLSYTRLAAPVISSQLEQYRDIAASMGLLVTCDRIGRLITQTDPQLLSTSDRSSRTTALNLTTADVVEIEWEQPYHWQSKTVVLEAITPGSTAPANKPVFSRAPGTAPASRGANVETLSKQICTQAVANTRCGLHFARVNSLYNGRVVPRGVRLILPDGYSVIDPAYQDFLTITLPATTNARGLSFDTTTKWLAKSADLNFDPETGAQDVSYTLDHETFGPDGRTEVRKQRAENGLPNLPPIDTNWPGWELPLLPIENPLTYGPNTLAAWANDGYVYRTSTFNNPEVSGGPTWARTQLSGLGMSGTFSDACENAFSPTGQKDGWLVTTTKIYKITDIHGAHTLTDQHTFANTTNLIRRSIDASFGFPGWVCVASTYSTNGATAGTQWTYTTDSGATWTNVSVATGGSTNVPSAAAWPGLHVSSNVAGLCYVSAVTAGSAGTRQLWRSLDYGATWAQVTPAIQAGATIGNAATLHVPFHDNPGDKLIFLSARLAVNNTYADMTLATAEVGVTGATDITPGAGGPGVYRRALTTLGNNRQWGAFIERVDGAGGSRNLWTTTSGGETLADWAQVNNIEAATSGYAWDSVALAGGPYSAHMYLWGEGGIAYSADMGLNIDSRVGNMGTLGISTSQIVNICGG